jgi:hypothetical protein
MSVGSVSCFETGDKSSINVDEILNLFLSEALGGIILWVELDVVDVSLEF